MELHHFILAIVAFAPISILSLMCHRKECTTTLDCMQGWDICADKYCYMLRARNITNPMQFNLRRGCIGEPPEIRYSKELQAYKSLNQCQRIVWNDIEFLLKICAEDDYCNYCDFWVEALPIKAGALDGGRELYYPLLIIPVIFMAFLFV